VVPPKREAVKKKRQLSSLTAFVLDIKSNQSQGWLHDSINLNAELSGSARSND
jgi:hypothetical protein